MNRRYLLKSAGLLTLGYPLLRLSAIQTSPQFSTDPFSAGVASGDPTRNSIVLWTRLIPDATVERDWTVARAWLYERLAPGPSRMPDGG